MSSPKLPPGALDGWPSERAKSAGPGFATGSGANGSQSSGMPPLAGLAAGGGAANRRDDPELGGAGAIPKPASGSTNPADAAAGARPGTGAEPVAARPA